MEKKAKAKAALAIGPARRALVLEAGNDVCRPVEVLASSLAVAGDALTVTVAVELLAPVDMPERLVDRVLMIEIPGEEDLPAFTTHTATLVSPVRFGAGHGLHLPAGSLLLRSIEEE